MEAEKARLREKVWAKFDGGQGPILFYNTESWAADFFAKAGYQLYLTREHLYDAFL